MNLCEKEFWGKKEELGGFEQSVRIQFARIEGLVAQVTNEFSASLLSIQKALTTQTELLRSINGKLFTGYAQLLKGGGKELGELSRSLQFYNPLRQLRLGYSILSRGGTVIRGTAMLQVGEYFDARLSDGTIEAQVEKISSLPVQAGREKHL